MPIIRIASAAVIAAALAAPLSAETPLTPLQQDVASELPNYGFNDVDVRSLSPAQIAHIKHLLYSNQSVAKIRGNIGAVLGDSLIRTLLN